MKWKVILDAAVIGVAMLGLPVSASPAEAHLRLDDLLKEAREVNPLIRASGSMTEAARARIPQARSLDDPTIILRNEPGNEQMLAVEQMIPFPTKLSARGAAVEARAESAAAMRDRTLLEVLVEVKHAFHHLVHWRLKIEVNLENQEILRRFVRIAETRYLLGRAGQEDVLKAQVEAGSLANELIMLNRMKSEEEANLARLLNRSTSGPLPPPETPPLPDKLGFTEPELLAMAEQNRQEITALASLVRAGDHEARLARLDYVPDLVLGAEWGRMDGTFGPASERWGAMLGVRVPVWFPTKQRNAVRETEAMVQASRDSLQDVKNRVRFEVVQAHLNVSASRAQLDVFNTGLLPQAEQDLRIATASYEAGKMDFLRLLDSQRGLRELKIEYYDALLEHYMSLGDLELAVGKELPIHSGKH